MAKQLLFDEEARRALKRGVDALADAGFLIERIPEPVPDPTAFSDRAFYDRIRRGPWFLFIRAVSPPDGERASG